MRINKNLLNNQVVRKNYVFLKYKKDRFEDKDTKKLIDYANCEVAEITSDGGNYEKLRFVDMNNFNERAFEDLVLGDVIALDIDMANIAYGARIVDFADLIIPSNLRVD